MKKRHQKFSLADKVLEPHEQDLVQRFLYYLSDKYGIDLRESEFSFQWIGMGLSQSTKLLALADSFYPFFLKISDNASIQRESSNFTKATARIPPLHLPPRETLISSEDPAIKNEVNDGYSLLAVPFLTDSSKGQPPTSLFEAFPRLTTYQMVEIIDEIFQVVFRDFHSFHKLSRGNFRPVEPRLHNIEIFNTLGRVTLSAMVERYNQLAASCAKPSLPHGIIHGDLHCENIILNKRNMPLIIDFEMMQMDGCLINDFAEFEIALVVAALDADVELYGPTIRGCYGGATMFEVFGVDKIVRAIRTIRANLAHNLFNLAKIPATREFLNELDYIYKITLLRYICSYTWFAAQSMSERRSLVVVGVLTTIFEQLYATVTDPIELRSEAT
jgi:Ternary complex associated domain 9